MSVFSCKVLAIDVRLFVFIILDPYIDLYNETVTSSKFAFLNSSYTFLSYRINILSFSVKFAVEFSSFDIAITSVKVTSYLPPSDLPYKTLKTSFSA